MSAQSHPGAVGAEPRPEPAMVVLVGFMGAGKSTVGALLAARLGVHFLDVDEEVTRLAGRGAEAIFATEGEKGWRTRERAAAGAALRAATGVVALGGGALTDGTTRAALAGRRVVHLAVSLHEALRRIGDPASRPMLAGSDPAALYAARTTTYEDVADTTVDTDCRTAEEVVDAIAGDDGGTRQIVLRPASGPCAIVVGSGLLDALDRHLPELAGARSAFVVTQAGLEDLAATVRGALERAGLAPHLLCVPDGEEAKTLPVVQRLYGELAAQPARRRDLVIAVGGGAVTDVAGFVASTFVRGMRLVNVPTTLLGQVDAAIGGKNGVNLPEAKNQIGTIHQPRAVVCDVKALASLPEAELRSGLAEVVKYGFIADPSLLDLVAGKAAAIFSRDEEVLIEIVTRSVRIKGRIVVQDEREHGQRELLNYGHTVGHAIEQTLSYAGGIRHGEAVALGMMAAAYLAHEMGKLDEASVALHREVLSALGLPVRLSVSLDSLEHALTRDKKYRDGQRFVLLDEPGRAHVGVRVQRGALVRAIERMNE